MNIFSPAPHGVGAPGHPLAFLWEQDLPPTPSQYSQDPKEWSGSHQAVAGYVCRPP